MNDPDRSALVNKCFWYSAGYDDPDPQLSKRAFRTVQGMMIQIRICQNVLFGTVLGRIRIRIHYLSLDIQTFKQTTKIEIKNHLLGLAF